ncbi:hypothetical protein N8Z24_00610 [bacterium]|nr:hypothetical protein [bacterium]
MTRVEKEVVKYLDRHGPSSMIVVETTLCRDQKFYNKFKRRMRVKLSIQSLISSGEVVINKDRKLERREREAQ